MKNIPALIFWRNDSIALIFLSLLTLAACNDDQPDLNEQNIQATYLKENPKNMTIKDSLMLPYKELPEFDVVRSVGLGRYRVDVHTHVLNDTLDVPEPMFAYPIAMKQELKFYEDGRLIGTRPLAIDSRKMRTLSGKEISAPGIPQYMISLIRGGRGDCFYYISGSDFCAIGNCPEFTGIYTLEGQVVLEETSTKGSLSRKYISLLEFCERYQFEKLNNPIEEEKLFP